MKEVHEQYGYVNNQISTEKAIASNPIRGFTFNCSQTQFSLMQDEPNDKGELFKEELLKLQPLIWPNISPVSCEKCKLVVDFSSPATSEEEVFRRLAAVPNNLFDQLSDDIGIPKLMQDISFRFRSGSTMIEYALMGTAFSTPQRTRKNTAFFLTPNQKSLFEHSLFRKNKLAGIEYSWAINMKIAVSEEEAVYPLKENNWAIERFSRLLGIALDVRRKAGKVIQV